MSAIEKLVFVLLMLGGLSALGAVAAWVCDWLERRFPDNHNRRFK